MVHRFSLYSNKQHLYKHATCLKAHEIVIHKYKDRQKRAIEEKKRERENEAYTLPLKCKAINQEHLIVLVSLFCKQFL